VGVQGVGVKGGGVGLGRMGRGREVWTTRLLNVDVALWCGGGGIGWAAATCRLNSSECDDPGRLGRDSEEILTHAKQELKKERIR
jgi:hypothetical protein